MNHLKKIERSLARVDPEALSFDHEEARQSKEALLRIADRCIALCSKIKITPERTNHQPPDDEAAESAARMRRAMENTVRHFSLSQRGHVG